MKVTSSYLKKSDISYYEEAAKYFCDLLNMHHNNISVSFRREIEHSAYGWCYPCKENIQDIRIHIFYDQTEDELLKTLAHELTHAYQYKTGLLVAEKHDDFWRGDRLNEKEDEEKYGSYELLPYERDAYANEEKFLKRWRKHEEILSQKRRASKKK